MPNNSGNLYNFNTMSDILENSPAQPENATIHNQQSESGLSTGTKAMPVMVYTKTRIIWGDVHINENLRVGLVLQSTSVPDYISLYGAKIVDLESSVKSAPFTTKELHIPTPEVIGFHLMPSHTEPVDYDQNAPNRKMEPIIALLGKFHFHGKVRMSTQTNIKKFLEVSRSAFISIYDLEIVQADKPNQQPMKVTSAQVRRTVAIITLDN